MTRRSLRLLTAAPLFALIAVACGGGSGSHSTGNAAAGGSPHESMMPTHGAMMMPPYAKHMKVSITSPSSAITVTANTVTLGVATSGYTDTCATAGKPNEPGVGHYHVLLDKSLVNMFCTPRATVSMQNVTPGIHTLEVVPALDDHTEVTENETSIKVDYKPTNPLPVIRGSATSAKPSITILSPKPGQTVSGSFNVVVRIRNFHPSCALMGKPDLLGYGHWHVNLDSTGGGMMGMGNMLAMSCTNVLHASTQGLKAGQTHTLIALLVDNAHAPLMPAVEDKVTVHIG